MINTYFESKLHKSLKEIYAKKYNGKTEQNFNGKICDILTPDNQVIEIQTSNLGKLYSKLEIMLPNNTVRIVHPIATTKYIETRTPEGTMITHRKSPKKLSLQSIFKELTGIWPFLLNKNLTLEILETIITEERIKTEKPVQLKNKSLRHKRYWYKQDKRLEKITNTTILKTPQDYLFMLPKQLPEFFSIQDLKNCGYKTEANYMIWVLKKMELIVFSHKKERKNFFTINSNFLN